MADINFGNFTDRHNFNFGETQVRAIDFGDTNIWQNQLQITNFERTSAASIANTAGNIGVRVTGDEGAQFSITGGNGASNIGNRTIPAGGVDTFNVPVSAQGTGAGERSPSALLVPNPTGPPPTILSTDFSATNPITVSQAAGPLPFAATLLSGSFAFATRTAGRNDEYFSLGGFHPFSTTIVNESDVDVTFGFAGEAGDFTRDTSNTYWENGSFFSGRPATWRLPGRTSPSHSFARQGTGIDLTWTFTWTAASVAGSAGQRFGITVNAPGHRQSIIDILQLNFT